MSFLIENRSANEINNKDRECFLSFERKEDYSFKYIPESHFKRIVKNVQRRRRKEDEERRWASFVEEQELNSFKFVERDADRSGRSAKDKDLSQESSQPVDRELKRLQEDALPERSKGIPSRKSISKNEPTYAKAADIDIGNDSSKRKISTKSKDARRTTALAATLRANNASAYKDAEREESERKATWRCGAKKCSSDSSIAEKKRYTNRLLRATDLFESDSDTDSSNDGDEIVYVQPDPLTVQKLLSMQKKIADLLDEILFRLGRIPLPDGENDLKRRQQQTLEFAIRFSRNYLYNLNRLVTSIQRHVKAVSSRAGLKQYRRNIAFHRDTIKQKLIAAHQLSIQALNAYYKHIPNSVLEGHSTKLQDALQIVRSLTDICDKVEISNAYLCSGDAAIVPLGKNLRDKCDAILSRLQLNLESKPGGRDRKNAEAPVSSRNHRKGRSTRKNLSSRLSMYSMDVKVAKNDQKRRSDLRRKSYACQKENASTVKGMRNLHVQHYSLPELLYPSPITHTSSSRDVQIVARKNPTYSKEGDNVRTVMDELAIDSENDSNVDVEASSKAAPSTGQLSETAKLRKVPSADTRRSRDLESKRRNATNEDDDLIKKVTTITKEHLATLAPVLNDLVALVSKKQNELEAQPDAETSVETLREFLQRYRSPKDRDTKACDKKSMKHGSSEILRRGENVQLLCISSTDKVSKTAQRDASCQADYRMPLKITDDRNPGDSKGGVELGISKEAKLQFLAYRREYKQLCESRPMYSSNTQNKPWDIVAWISDKLIEELLIEIAEDFQMKDRIKKMYQMEFQEF